MKKISICFIVIGCVFVLWGLGIGKVYDAGGIALSISGSIIVGSGVIALAITQAFGKKS